jgi:hypothetical protein
MLCSMFQGSLLSKAGLVAGHGRCCRTWLLLQSAMLWVRMHMHHILRQHTFICVHFPAAAYASLQESLRTLMMAV